MGGEVEEGDGDGGDSPRSTGIVNLSDVLSSQVREIWRKSAHTLQPLSLSLLGNTSEKEEEDRSSFRKISFLPIFPLAPFSFLVSSLVSRV